MENQIPKPNTKKNNICNNSSEKISNFMKVNNLKSYYKIDFVKILFLKILAYQEYITKLRAEMNMLNMLETYCDIFLLSMFYYLMMLKKL